MKQIPVADNFGEITESTPGGSLSPTPRTKDPSGKATDTAPPLPQFTGEPRPSVSPARPLSVAFEKDNLIRRTGVLSKRNATGLRNWKKVVFTLHRTKLS
jgi:hypothetical protein